jgi:hypothetical protein
MDEFILNFKFEPSVKSKPTPKPKPEPKPTPKPEPELILKTNIVRR